MLSPAEVRLKLGGHANFDCTSHTELVTRFEWLINGTQLVDHSSMDVIQEFIPIGNNIGRLQLTNLTIAYNTTQIKCEATLSSGKMVSSNAVTMYLFAGM